MSKFTKYTITTEFHDCRLDRWFRKNISNISQSKLELALRIGDIKVNDVKVKSSHRVHTKDCLTIYSDLLKLSDGDEIQKIDSIQVDLIKNSIIYEDHDVIAINKPRNLAVQGGSKIRVSIDDILPHLGMGSSLKLVHRLDKDTTGVLLIAKNALIARKLSFDFQNRTMGKIYQAILTNTPKLKKGNIKNYVRKAKIGDQEQMIICKQEDDGDLAITNYRIIQQLQRDHCSVEFIPLTGRTHQLRLHAQHLNCSILGDQKYNIIKQPVTEYMHLHAESIQFMDRAGKSLVIRAPLPEFFQKTINKLSIAKL